MRKRLGLAIVMSTVLVATAAPLGVDAAGAKRPTARKLDARKIDRGAVQRLLKDRRDRENAEIPVIVKLAGDPVAVHSGRAIERTGRDISSDQKAVIRGRLGSQRANVEGQVRRLGGRVTNRFDTVFNGIVVRIKAGRLGALAALDSVVSIEPTRIVRRTHVNSIPYIGVPSTWSAYSGGVTGSGVRISIIDTGIDYTHANFGGPGTKAAYDANDPEVVEPGTFPTAKVVGGYDLVGDDYDASSDDPAEFTPNPDPDPLDCNGHGSHVAGSAAGFGVRSNGATYTGPYNTSTLGSNSFRIGPGVAPRAKLLAYKVFGCEGSASSEIVTEAIERSVEAGAHVINMSLGVDIGEPDDVNAEASNNASYAGVTVVTSAGNSGHSAFVVGSPGTADRAIAVAAIDSNPSYPYTTIKLNSPAATIEAQVSNGDTNDLPLSGVFNYFVDNPATPTDPDTGAGGEHLGCDAAAYAFNGFAAGQIAVVTRGGCARVQKAEVGDAQGAKAVVMINTAPEFPPFEGPIAGVDIPFLGVPSTADAALKANDLDNGTITAATNKPNPGYRRSAGFTSGGPRSYDNALKPDVSAPGVGIVSTFVGTGNGALSLSGTSMASPHVAGVAALVKQRNPNWSPSRIKAAIMGTANANNMLEYDTRINGSGVVRPRRAIDTYGFVTTNAGNASLHFNYQERSGAIDVTRTFQIWNTSSSPVTYDFSNAPNGPTYGANVTVSPASVTVPAQVSGKGAGRADVTVRIRLTAAEVAALPSPSYDNSDLIAEIATVKGAVVATPRNATARRYPLRVPYLLTPRGTSDIYGSQKGKYTQSGGIATTSTTLRNYGVHRGIADVYAWGLLDGNEGFRNHDLRAMGVQTLPGQLGGSTEGDRLLVFAFNTWSRHSNASDNVLYVDVDTANCPVGAPTTCRDNDPEYFIIGVDLGLLLGNTNGVYVSLTIDARTGDLTAFYGAEAPHNSSTVLLPTLASSLGLKETGGDADFEYTGFAECIYCDFPTFDVATTGRSDQPQAGFHPWDPPVSQGDFIPLDPGASTVLTLSVDRAQYSKYLTKGWMIVTTDDPSGARQAETILAAPLP